MTFLTHGLGPFPVGLWIALVILLVCGGFFTIIAQGLSFWKWDTALALRLQEDSRTSPDPAERTVGAMSQGEAGADVIVHGTLIVLAAAGILWKHPVGFVAGMAQGILWVYVTFMVVLQRWMLCRGGVVRGRGEARGPDHDPRRRRARAGCHCLFLGQPRLFGWCPGTGGHPDSAPFTLGPACPTPLFPSPCCRWRSHGLCESL